MGLTLVAGQSRLIKSDPSSSASMTQTIPVASIRWRAGCRPPYNCGFSIMMSPSSIVSPGLTVKSLRTWGPSGPRNGVRSMMR